MAEASISIWISSTNQTKQPYWTNILRTSKFQISRANTPPDGKLFMSCLVKARKLVSRSTKDTALHQHVRQIYLQNGADTSAPCLTTAIVNHHRFCPLLLPRTYRSWPIHQQGRRHSQPYAMNMMKTKKLLGSTVKLELKPFRMVVM